ncbi:peptidogalycan biosysnthesis protein [Streptomyces sp. NPDC048258]|uniref:peptidogalycan biosysnthesis protein n=1 Tax=Streptomyces sp. NPDC048258 TaxID=3365527 RepID=UPI0037226A21
MLDTEILHTVEDIPSAEWNELTREEDIDSARGFLRFREYLEPGDGVLVAARRAGRLVGALRGVVAVPHSGLSSDPWKFVTSDAVLRLGEGPQEDPVSAAALRGLRDELVLGTAARTAAPGTTGTGAPLWQALTRQAGPCLVVREFDRSEVLADPGLDPAQRELVVAHLVRQAQISAAGHGAGAVAFPYVSPSDTVLRRVLAECGFRGGALTGASWIRTGGFTTYEEYLESLPSRRRRRYRQEEEQLRASGLAAGEVGLRENAGRIAVLEANTLVKHGGKPDAEAIRQARVALAGMLPEAVRIPAVRRDDGEIIACAMHLLGRKSVVFMTYGCDYSVEDRAGAYPWAAFYHPVRTAVESGVPAVRLGLEGFEAKARRGAVVEARELWVWTPDRGLRGRLGELLDLVGGRNTAHLGRFAAHGTG